MALIDGALRRLVDLAGPALGPLLSGDIGLDTAATAGLAELLELRNGFLAFESALHVLPATGSEMTLAAWNADDLWRDGYGELTKGLLFFAEDVFGVQFALRGETVVTFDPETGGIETIAKDLEGWASALLDSHEVLTGYPLAHKWQQTHGELPPGERLIPKMPFVLGGEFALDNLYALNAIKGMRLRAEIARQIKKLPDGTHVRLVVGE
jgi:CubicO group peptidase (beta-lactamase class C family)